MLLAVKLNSRLLIPNASYKKRICIFLFFIEGSLKISLSSKPTSELISQNAAIGQNFAGILFHWRTK